MPSNEKKGLRGRLFLILAVVLPVLAIAVVFLAPALAGIRLGGAVIGVLVIVAGAAAIRAMNLGRRDLTPRAAELRRKDSRPPVVYLRPFSDDGVQWKVSFLRSRRKVLLRNAFFPTNESRLGLALRRLGPFVGIGNPREERPPLGAARMYVRGESWQQAVTQLLDEAALVVLHAGESDGVVWEIGQVLSRVPPEKVILCVPLDKSSERPDPNRWATFRKRTENLFPIELPSEIGKGEFVYFDADWTPRVLAPDRGNPPPSGSSLRDQGLQALHEQFLHVTTPYALRALGKVGLVLVVTIGVLLNGASILTRAIDTIEHGTFGVFSSRD